MLLVDAREKGVSPPTDPYPPVDSLDPSYKETCIGALPPPMNLDPTTN